MYFRNLNHPISRPSVVSRRQEIRTDLANARADSIGEDKRYEVTYSLLVLSVYRSRSHIFDGVTVTKETAAFQLCDLEDPMLKEMVEDEEDLREICNVSEPGTRRAIFDE